MPVPVPVEAVLQRGLGAQERSLTLARRAKARPLHLHEIPVLTKASPACPHLPREARVGEERERVDAG